MLLASAASLSFAQSLPAQPKTWTSASGHVTFERAPGDRWGRGPVRYTMRRDGQIVWTREHVLLLDDAVVDDLGHVAGAGTSDEEFVVARFDEDGDVSLLAHERLQYLAVCPGPATTPRSEGIHLLEDAGLLLVRVYRNGAPQEWWTFRLSSGAPLERVPMRALSPEAEYAKRSRGARPIPGTPLVLVHWTGTDADWITGCRYWLGDAFGNAVWELHLPGDLAVFGDEEAEQRLAALVYGGGALLDVAPDGFAVWSARSRERLDFSVQRDEDGGWVVAQAARTPFDLAEVEPPNAVPVEETTLEERGRVWLERRATRGIRTVSVDRRGRVYLLERFGDELSCFESSGELLSRTRIDGRELGKYDSIDLFDVAGDRAVLQLPRRQQRLLAIDPTDGSWEVRDEVPSSGVRYVPGRESRWVARWSRVELQEPDGRVSLVLERAPNGDWLRSVDHLAVAPDGALAIVDSTEYEPRLHVWDARGVPTFSLDVPARTSAYGLAFDGERIALLGDGELLLFDLGRTRQFRAAVSPEASHVFFSPDGAELWIFPWDALRFDRYATPR